MVKFQVVTNAMEENSSIVEFNKRLQFLTAVREGPLGKAKDLSISGRKNGKEQRKHIWSPTHKE